MPYQCTCGTGWEQNDAGDACVDIDECLLHTTANFDAGTGGCLQNRKHNIFVHLFK